MNCLKCGVEIPERQCFCDRCRASMEGYPIRSDVPVFIPKRQAVPAPKRQRRTIKPEEQIARLRKSNRALRILAGVLLLVVLAFSGVAVLHFRGSHTGPAKGQNFNTSGETTIGSTP